MDPSLPPPSAPSSTWRLPFLTRALLNAPDEAAVTALLNAVDWNEPVASLAYVCEQVHGLRGGLGHLHALVCVLMTGREDWLEQALPLAHAGNSTALDLEKNLPMADWVGNGVLNQTLAMGSQRAVGLVLGYLERRGALSSRVPLDTNRPGPVLALSKGSAHRPTEHWRDVLRTLDRYVRHADAYPAPQGPLPARWAAAERRRRAIFHGQVLLQAAGHGPAALVDALMELGHAPLGLNHVVAALEQGRTELAWRLVSDPAAAGLLEVFPVSPDATPPSDRWPPVRAARTLGERAADEPWRRFVDGVATLGWRTETMPACQVDALVRLVVWAAPALGRLPAEDLRAELARLAPALGRLDSEQTMAVLQGPAWRSPLGWNEWCVLNDQGLLTSPWGRQRLADWAALAPDTRQGLVQTWGQEERARWPVARHPSELDAGSLAAPLARLQALPSTTPTLAMAFLDGVWDKPDADDGAAQARATVRQAWLAALSAPGRTVPAVKPRL